MAAVVALLTTFFIDHCVAAALGAHVPGDAHVAHTEQAGRLLAVTVGVIIALSEVSPDGRFVVATSLSQGKWGNPAVMIFDFNTRSWTGLEKDPIDNKWWSMDGKYFYFDKYMENDPAIFRVRISDRQIERLASLKNMRRAFNEMGWWMGIAPDGSPMVLRDTSIEEIYALDWIAP
jgi:hypothetical protein